MSPSIAVELPDHSFLKFAVCEIFILYLLTDLFVNDVNGNSFLVGCSGRCLDACIQLLKPSSNSAFLIIMHIVSIYGTICTQVLLRFFVLAFRWLHMLW